MLEFNKTSVRVLHLESTSVCQASCPQCARENSKLFNKQVEHLTIEAIQQHFSIEQIQKLDKMFMCGNFGDPAAGANTLEIYHWFRELNPDIILGMNTNGGLQNPSWWSNLADIFRLPEDYVIFSIDGLEDTNHIYRRGVIWSRLIQNLQEFNTAGGHSQWKSIIFDYNKHQILSMIKIAHEIGCGSFVTNRNRCTGKIISCQSYKKFPKAKITSPSFEEFKEKYNIKLKFNKHRYTLIPELSFDGDYSCPFGQEGKVTIDIFGNIWPCCFFYSNSFKTWNKPILNKFYTDNINILKNNYTDILDFIRTDLYSAWKQETYSLCKNCLHKKIPPLT